MIMFIAVGACAAGEGIDGDDAIDGKADGATTYLRVPLISQVDEVPVKDSNDLLIAAGVRPVTGTARISQTTSLWKVWDAVNKRFAAAGLEEPYYTEPDVKDFLTDDPATSLCYRGYVRKAFDLLDELRYSEHSLDYQGRDADRAMLVDEDNGFGDVTRRVIPLCP